MNHEKMNFLEKRSIMRYFATYAHPRTTYALFMTSKKTQKHLLTQWQKTGSVGCA